MYPSPVPPALNQPPPSSLNIPGYFRIPIPPSLELERSWLLRSSEVVGSVGRSGGLGGLFGGLGVGAKVGDVKSGPGHKPPGLGPATGVLNESEFPSLVARPPPQSAPAYAPQPGLTLHAHRSLLSLPLPLL